MALSQRAQAAIVAALAVAVYANTLGHGYALDDRLVVTHNEDTKAGLSGLPEIFASDYLSGYLGERANPMTGGRYRPLSLVTFAVETALFGSGRPLPSHLINVLLYALCCALLYRVLVELLRERAARAPTGWLSLPFAAALLFTVHPLHTEVVANIKSRDEILALGFALASVALCLRAVDRRTTGPAIGAVVCFFLALLSKESAITFLAVVPLSLWFFRADAWAGIQRVMPGLAVAAAAYLVLRTIIVSGPSVHEEELLNDPFLGATLADTYATIAYTLGRYARLLVWPHPLTNDYMPFHIPILSWRDIGPWWGLAVQLALVAIVVSGLRKRSVPAYAAAFYLATLSIASNLVVPTGAFMAERFLFAPSAGAALGLAWALLAAVDQLVPAPRRALIAALVVLAPAAALAALTVQRNPTWKDSYTLFTTDIAVSSDSALANANAADVELIRASETADASERELLEQAAIGQLEAAVRIHPRYERALEMLATAHRRRDEFDDAIAALERLFTVNPRRSNVAFNLGTLLLEHRPERRADAVHLLELAVEAQPGDADARANLGVAYYQNGDAARAIAAFERAVELAPGNASHRANLDELRREAAEGAR
jgi:protein O-mannosyl-transferase